MNTYHSENLDFKLKAVTVWGFRIFSPWGGDKYICMWQGVGSDYLIIRRIGSDRLYVIHEVWYPSLQESCTWNVSRSDIYHFLAEVLRVSLCLAILSSLLPWQALMFQIMAYLSVWVSQKRRCGSVRQLTHSEHRAKARNKCLRL